MTPRTNDTWTTGDLLEQAILDALGLLDEADAQSFDAAFRAAPPHVQAELRREQTRMTDILHLLPAAETPVALRARVLRALREARDAARPAEHVALRLAHDAGRAVPAGPRRAARVAALWRTLALGAAAAAVVFGGLTIQLRSDYHRLEQQLKGNALFERLAAEFGPDFVIDALVDRDTQRLTLTSTELAPEARGAVWSHPEWTAARFFAVNLPQADPGKTYRLAVLDAEGNPVRVLTTFSFSGLVNEEIPLDVVLASSRLAVIGDESGKELVLELARPGA